MDSSVPIFTLTPPTTTDIHTLSLHDALPISLAPSNADTALWQSKETRNLRALFPGAPRHRGAPGKSARKLRVSFDCHSAVSAFDGAREMGRASCRERVWMSVVVGGVSVKIGTELSIDS